MKNILAFLGKKKFLEYDTNGVHVVNSKDSKSFTDWGVVEKIIITDAFEEYSGYFLTDDYNNKTFYNDIKICCDDNLVKVRTDGKPKISKNMAKPFLMKFGTTCLFNTVFVTYKDGSQPNLFGVHYKPNNKQKLIDDLKNYIDFNKIIIKGKVEGFQSLSTI